MPRQRQLSERVITETSVISNHNTSIAEVSFVDNEIFRNGGYMEETRTELQMIKMYSIWKADNYTRRSGRRKNNACT